MRVPQPKAHQRDNKEERAVRIEQLMRGAGVKTQAVREQFSALTKPARVAKHAKATLKD